MALVRRSLPTIALSSLTLLAPIACGGKGTPAETEVLKLEYARKALTGYGDVTFGEPLGEPKTSKSLIVYDPGGGPLLQNWKPVTLRVEIDHGPVKLEHRPEGLPDSLEVPQEVRVVAVDVGGFEVEVECEPEMNQWDDGSPVVATNGEGEAVKFRPGVSRRCNVNLGWGGSNTMFDFEPYGDGAVIAKVAFDHEQVEVTPIE